MPAIRRAPFREPGQCCANVLGHMRTKPCSRMGTVERDGRVYCKQHDPEFIRAAHDARRTKEDAEYRRRQLFSDYNTARAQWLEDCATFVESCGTLPEFGDVMRELAKLAKSKPIRPKELAEAVVGINIPIGARVESIFGGSDTGSVVVCVGSDENHPMACDGNVYVAWDSGVRTWTPITNLTRLP